MLTRFADLFNSQEKLSDKWIFLLLFLFPIAGPVVRHWNTLIFVLITFTALYFLFAKKDRKPLYKEEKIYLWVFVLFFVVYIVSVNVNGYSGERIQKEGLGTEINFLLFVPIYLLIREYNFSRKALLAGVLLSIPVLFSFAFYEYSVTHSFISQIPLSGAYSQLYIGPIASLSLLMAYPAYKAMVNKPYYWLILIYIALGIFTIALSHARIAYITIIIGSVILLFLTNITIPKKISALALIILISISSYQIDVVKTRTDLAFKHITGYFNQIDNKVNESAKTNSGIRLEVWRSAQYTIQERPLIGIGNGNYPFFIQKYIEQKLVDSSVTQMGQAHNTFIEVLITKGILGFILLLIIFYFPLVIAWKNKQRCYLNFITVSAFAIAISLMSMGESMLINKNNGLSYLLIFTAVLFSTMIREIKNLK